MLPLMKDAYNLARWLMKNQEDAEDMVQGIVPEGISFFLELPRGNKLPRLAAALAVVFGLVFLNQRGILDRSGGNALVEEVISSHVRSLLASRLLDVPSTDRHTVKPWFNGKLKFSPPVQHFTAQDFRLIGGRLDYIMTSPQVSWLFFKA
jgi:anti-sigma factor RsiW